MVFASQIQRVVGDVLRVKFVILKPVFASAIKPAGVNAGSVCVAILMKTHPRVGIVSAIRRVVADVPPAKSATMIPAREPAVSVPVIQRAVIRVPET